MVREEQKQKFAVLLDGNGWLAKHPSGFTMKFSSQAFAEEYARTLARQVGDCELTIYGPSGEIQKHENF